MPTTVSFPGLGLDFALDRVALAFGPFTVYWYGIIVVGGIVLAVAVAAMLAPKFGTDPDKLIDICTVSIVVGFIGARIYYVAFSWDYYRDHLNEIIRIWEGGIAFYGGLIAALLCALLLAKLWKVPFVPAADVSLMCVLLGQGIGRWGNFVNVEAFGGYTESVFRMVSPRVDAYLHAHPEQLSGFTAEEVLSMTDIPVHPTFLYESAWLLLGFAVIFCYMKRRRFSGEMALLYLFWNGLGRMVIEGLRTDSLMLGNVRVSQLLAAAMAVSCAAALLYLRRKAAAGEAPEWTKLPEPFVKPDKAAKEEPAAEGEQQPDGAELSEVSCEEENCDDKEN